MKGTAVARKTIAETKADKLARLEALKAEIGKLEDKETNRLGRLAFKAGLGEVQIPDTELLAALQELAGRFRQGSQKPAAPAPAPAAADRAAAE